jgi:hypothetical protein
MKGLTYYLIFILLLFYFNQKLSAYGQSFRLNPAIYKKYKSISLQMEKLKSSHLNNYTFTKRPSNKSNLQNEFITAKERLDTAIYYAKQFALDSELRAILLYEFASTTPTGDSIDGKSLFISYYFYSNQKGNFVVNCASASAYLDTSIVNFPFTGGTLAITGNFIDSDSVSLIAETNGGYQFRSEEGTSTSIFYELRNLSNEDLFFPDTSNIYWKVTYYKADTSYNPRGFLTFYINPIDGNIARKFQGDFNPVTIKEKFEIVDSVAKANYPDAKLMYALGFLTSGFDGRSWANSYGYLSQDTIMFTVNLFFGVPVLDDTSGWLFEDFEFNKQLELNSYLDSDTLFAIGELNGGKAFRETYQLISGGYLYSQSFFDTSYVRFHSIYNGVDSTTGYEKNLFLLIDPVTGNFITSILLKNESKIVTIPNNFILYQNYPNPFNSATKIKYYIPISGNASIKIYDLLGRELKTLVSGYHTAGEYEITFDAGKLSSGIYFYELKTEKSTLVKKMVLLK